MEKKYYNNKNYFQAFEDNQIKTIQNIVDSSLTYVNGKKLELKGKILLYWCTKLSFKNTDGNLTMETFGDLLKKEIPTITSISYDMNEYSKELVDKAVNYDTVIFISYNSFSKISQSKMINELNQICSNFFVISIRNPYDYLSIEKNINFYTMYEPSPNSMRTIIKFLKGEIEPKGVLPIELKHN